MCPLLESPAPPRSGLIARVFVLKESLIQFLLMVRKPLESSWKQNRFIKIGFSLFLIFLKKLENIGRNLSKMCFKNSHFPKKS